MKKILGLGLILLLACSFFAFARGGQQQSSGKTEIVYSYWGDPLEVEAMEKVFAEYNKLQDKVTVKGLNIPQETYLTRLNTMALAGNLPECGMGDERGILTYAANGLLADVSEMYGPNEPKPLDSLIYRAQDGKPVAYASSNEILMLYYNKAMFDKAGIAYPPVNVAQAWTWDQFVDVAKRLTLDSAGRNATQAGFDRNNIVQYGCSVATWTWQLDVWCRSNGSGFFSPDGKSVTVNSDASIEAIQRVADLYLVHGVAPLNPGLTDDQIPRTIVAGNVAMSTCGQWNIGTCLPDWTKAGNSYGIGVLPYMKEKVTLNTSGARVVFNVKDAAKRKAAMDFIKWFSRVENSWFLVELGIWMPVTMNYYTPGPDMEKWITGVNHPPREQYIPAVVNYTLSNAQPTSWFYTPNYDAFEPILRSALGDVWTGRATARNAINGSIDAMRRAHAGQ